MFTVRGIVLHLTASPFGDARQVDRWHRERGFSGIGYHHVILNGVRISGRQYNVADDGVHERGRAETVQGAHCAAGGMNRVTLGVSCIGTPDRVPTGAQRAPATVTTKPYMTARQFATLVELLATLCTKYSLDPRGTFAHPVTGVATPVLSQHSQWDSGKPFCASVQIAAIREAVAAALAARGTRRRGGRRGTLARPLVLDDAQAIAVGDPSLEPDADPQLDGSDV
ncbi:MAG: peptidoglycan recognition protein family protein, partial [Gemmatimonadaceae bacterium]|nr:peptidoglycan recognition protein family protein [Gemmatimonadaceae bacterium]